LQENHRLKFALETAVESPGLRAAGIPGAAFVDDEKLDTVESRMFETQYELFPSVKKMWPNVILPSRSCSFALVEFDRIWNSWVHAALDHPVFEIEHLQFRERLENGDSIDSMEPSWLALYFSVIAVSFSIFTDHGKRGILSSIKAALLIADDDEANDFGLPSSE
jgi:hypothetical protein